MSEVTTAPEGDGEQTAPEPSIVEVQAQSKGWRPKEEFDADPSNAGKTWVDAEEFMGRSSLYEKIDEQHKRIRNLEKGLDAFAQHNKKIEESAYKRALQELKQDRRSALEAGDVVRAEELRDEIDELRENQNTRVEAPVNPQGPPPEFNAWKSRNDWYQKDSDLTVFADGVGNTLLAQGHTPDQILLAVERRVREAFPQKFRNPNKDSAPPVATGTRKAKSDGFQLTEMEEQIMNKLIRSGAPIKKEEYIAQIKQSRGV